MSIEPRTITVRREGQNHAWSAYQARLRLSGVVFDLFGYVPANAVRYGIDLDPEPSPALRRALLPIWPAERDEFVWPPSQAVDVLGRSDGPEQTPLH